MGMGKGKGQQYDDDKHVEDDKYVEDDKMPYDDDEGDDFLEYDDKYDKSNGCVLVQFNETFVVPAASLFVAPDTTPTVNGDSLLPGTLFIFELSNILEPDGETPIAGTKVSGTCTRTTFGTEGGGICSFVFVDDEDYTINVDGYLKGPFGSPLAISGGTGGMVGVIGEMDFFPIYNNGTSIDGDIFIDPLRYEVIADLGLIVCD
jgi:hypothetical protein